MRQAFIEALRELAHTDERVILLTADLGWTIVEPFVADFPDRFLNVGVAEQNLMGVATGLALAGYVPFVYSIASFASMRGYEQFRNGAVLHNLPLRIVAVGGGYAYGHAGPTHYALEDLALYRTQPNVRVIVPADDAQAKAAVQVTKDLRDPVYFRLGKGSRNAVPHLAGAFRFDTPELIRSGSDLLIVTCGDIVHEAIAAAETISAAGCSAAIAVVAHLPSAPPLALVELLSKFPSIVSVEEGYRAGGLSSLIADAIASNGLASILGVCAVSEPLSARAGSDRFLRRQSRLDAESIVETSFALLDHGQTGNPDHHKRKDACG